MSTIKQNNDNQKNFSFEGVEVSSELEKETNVRLQKILEIAPPRACAAGVLYKTESRYCSTVMLESRLRHFIQRASGTNPKDVINKVLSKLENDLFVWRHGTGAPQAQVAVITYKPMMKKRIEIADQQIA